MNTIDIIRKVVQVVKYCFRVLIYLGVVSILITVLMLKWVSQGFYYMLIKLPIQDCKKYIPKFTGVTK